jgi:hypothetical protein
VVGGWFGRPPLQPAGGFADTWDVLCDRCGRLLNRATGRCVCEDYGGNPPPPIAVTHPPPERPVPVSRAAVAVLDLSDRPMKEFGHQQAEIPGSPCPDADEFPVVLRLSMVDEDAVARSARKLWVKRVVLAVVGLVGLAGIAFGAAKLLAADPPTPPPPAPPVTLAPVEVMVRAELASTCPAWAAFAAAIPAGERPDPAALGPVVGALHPHLVKAAGPVPYYAAARDEAEYLQGYAGRTPEEIERESVSRVQYALTTVSAACARALSPS